MKTYLHNTRYLAFAVFALLLCVCSCHRAPSEADRLLDCVDSLCYTDPDSAVALVSQIPDSTVGTWPEATRMRYHLMHIKALDKAYLDITGDTLMPTVLSYYKSRNDRRFLPESYFYMGRWCADLGDAPQAVSHFLKIKDCVDTLHLTSKNATFLGTVYSQIGDLYNYQYLFEYAISSYRQALKYDYIANDSLNMCYDLRDLAKTYRTLERPDSALYYCDKAYSLASAIADLDIISDILVVKGSICNMLGQYRESVTCIYTAFPNLHHASFSGAYHVISKAYQELGMLDSAEYYYREIFDHGTIYAKESASLGMIGSSLSRHDFAHVEASINRFLSYSDSCNRLRRVEAVEKANHLYNYSLREKRADQLLQDKIKRENVILVTVILILLLSLAVIVLCVILILRKKRIEKQELLIAHWENMYIEQKKDYLVSKQAKETLDERIQEISEENDNLRSQLEQNKHLYEDQQAYRIQRKKHVVLLKKSTSYSHLCQLLDSDTILKDESYKNLEAEVFTLFPRFQTFLDNIKLSEIEKRFCVLMKCELPVGKIATLLGRERTSGTIIPKRLYNKVFGHEGTSRDWAAFIEGL